MSEWYEIDAAWDADGYASDMLLKLGETSEWCDLVDEVAGLTHATTEEAYDGMAKALRGYLESLDGQDVTDGAGRVTDEGELLHDTREKLEDDLEKLRAEWKNYDGNFMRIYSDVAYAQIVELLDRQAAITEAECERICDTCDWPSLAAQPDQEAYDRIAELEAQLADARKALDIAWVERDVWKDAYEDSERMRLKLVEESERANMTRREA